MRHLIAFTLLCSPAALLSQQGEHTISPGMTRAQVDSALGTPATTRTVSEFSYLFYANSCGRACGMNDLVILHSDSVVDAIFRSPNRHYTGQSSSPEEARPRVSARKSASASKPLAAHKDATPATKPKAAAAGAPGGPMKPPAEAHDIHPSIPLNPGTVKPAPTKTAAPAKTPAKAAETPAKPGAAGE
jgi:SmpA / OmlA family